MLRSEKEIQNDILDFLKIVGVFCWTNNNIGVFDPVKKIYRKSNSKHSLRGISDIIGVIDGRFLAIEVKSKSGIISPEQRIFLAKINEQGGIGFVARSVEQTIDSLTKIFPDNENLKRYSRNYIGREPRLNQ